MDSNILLESGTNEFEVLEFVVNGNHYGINVEKVREILTYQPVTPVPNSHPCIEGIFMPRGDIITVIDLFGALGYDRDDRSNDFFIVTNFNNLSIAFDVEYVLGIMWMVIGLVQLVAGNGVMGMLDMIVGVQFMILSEMEKKK